MRKQIPFRTILLGEAVKHPHRAQRVIMNERDWRPILSHHLTMSRSKLRDINFKKEMIIAVFLGEVSVAHGVEIKKIVETNEALTVEITESFPKPGTVHIMIVRSPVHVVSLPRSTKKIKFAITDEPS